MVSVEKIYLKNVNEKLTEAGRLEEENESYYEEISKKQPVATEYTEMCSSNVNSKFKMRSSIS